jgi:hypothetical protein
MTYGRFQTRGLILSIALALAAPAGAQSLHLDRGERAVEGSVGWSVGPSSNGVETVASVSLDGRLDLGIGINRYTYEFDDGSKSSFVEYAPFARVFLLKEQSGAPVSLALSGQLFLDDYGTDDSGTFVQVGTTVYKALRLSERLALHPFVGFAFVAESYTFGGGPADRAQYLTRDFGLHFTTSLDPGWLLRLTLIEQSFRRETYRGARAALIRRF